MMVTFGSPLQFATPSCNTNGNLGSSVNCSHPSGFTLTGDIDVTCTCDSYQAYSCSFHVTVTEVTTASTPSTPVTVSGPCAEYLDYRNANSETVFELVLPEDLELVTETIINSNQCPDLLPAMCSLFYPPLPSSGYTLCQETCSQLFADCQIAFALLAGAMPESCSNFPLRNEAGNMMCIGASEPHSSPVYLVALVIPVLLIIILLVVLFKRIRRKPATESKPVNVQDVDHVNAGVTDDHEDYIALEEQTRNTPAPKYQDLSEKEAPTQVSGYERTILETADAAPKAMPRQGIKRQTNYQYEDANLGETDARKLPSVPQPDLQSEDDTEYEVPDMFEEYTGVHINNLGASKPITPRPMKIIEYKTFMGRERSKVISEIVQQYTALKTGQQHPWTAAVKLQNKSKNFFKALLPYDHSRVRLDTDGSDVRSDYINASYIKHKNRTGPRQVPCGTPERTGADVDDIPSIITLWVICDKRLLIQQERSPRIP
ncbi:Receptor-type tyrosine-protein phosphatase mu [Apostichopus japonicus]|uniref:Receptor-type tyrosine-protein phosphatase mu n=1 Tax=Stichopus japonicus TaxID=307972 RepID=A0A2G8JWH3_STIJA|nr:Receptor-type tyrosine-protein phosphatase mu [Apostichopus japonicus]